MPDYLTTRNGFWQFVRRVPLEYVHLDTRGVIKHSTKVPISTDRRGAKAAKIAERMNGELEAYWRGLVEGKAQEAAERYAAARRRARTLGFEYVEADELASRSTLEILQRLEALVEKGLTEDPTARAAVLGEEKKPKVLVSEVWGIFETMTRNEIKDMSPNQLKRWRNGYMLAISDFGAVVGEEKALTDIQHTDILDYVDWLEARVEEEEIVAKTANKYMGHVSKMLKAINRRQRLGLADFFSGLRLEGVKDEARPPFPTEFVQRRILADGALLDLNDEARAAVLAIADTGMRLSECLNLNERTIHLDCEIPYVEVLPDGRRVKSKDSIREIPLVGTSLAAFRKFPKGFPRYHDRGASFSGYVNDFLLAKGLRPTRKHTVYSLRHTFKDRLIAIEAQDSLIEALMGHSDDHPKYGKGPSLELKQKWLHRIAFVPPTTL